MRIAVIGSSGQLGYDLCRAVGEDNVIKLTHADIEVSSRSNVDEVIARLKPDAIINTAAFHNVDQCEENPEKALAINAVGAWNVARAAKEHNAKYVFISSDYVYSGKKNKPYIEDDPIDPVNAYGVSKAAGEILIKNLGGKYFIVRSTGLYGIHKSGKGWNFVELMLKLARERDEVRVVTDQVLTPTYTLELAKMITLLLETDKYGTYNITNEGMCSWYDFAKKIFELEGVKTKLSPTTSQEFKTKATRPSYSVLEKRNLSSLKLKMSPWEKALESYLKERKQNENTVSK